MMHLAFAILAFGTSLTITSGLILAGDVVSRQVEQRLERRTSNLCLTENDQDFFAPELFLIGVQKGGTTTLWDVLTRHPSIYTPYRTPEDDFVYLPKEPHFYDAPKRYNKGRMWLLQHFPECDQNIQKVFIDGTPETITKPSFSASRIIEIYGDASSRIKFVVILRDPLKRMHSAFYNGQHDGWWGGRASFLTFQEYVTELLEGSVDPLGEDYKLSDCETNFEVNCMGPFSKSLYADQLEEFSTNFASQQFTVALFSNLVDSVTALSAHAMDKSSTLAFTIFQSLGLDTEDIELGGIPWDNPLSHPKLEDDLPSEILASAAAFMDNSAGGARAVAHVLATMQNATLFAFKGDRDSEDDIVRWLLSGW